MRKIFLFILSVVVSSAVARNPIEGEWKVNGDGPVLLFRQSDTNEARIDIIWVDGSGHEISTGSVVGYAVPSPSLGVYDCVGLDPRSSKGRKSSKSKNIEFVIRLDSEYGHDMTFEPYDRSSRLDFTRFFSRWLRVRIKSNDSRPKGLDGARRTDAPDSYVVL